MPSRRLIRRSDDPEMIRLVTRALLQEVDTAEGPRVSGRCGEEPLTPAVEASLTKASLRRARQPEPEPDRVPLVARALKVSEARLRDALQAGGTRKDLAGRLGMPYSTLKDRLKRLRPPA